MKKPSAHFLKLVFVGISFLLINSLAAQRSQYGGSASVQVKDDKGKTRTLNVVVTARYDTESYAKTDLLKSLESKKKSNEQFDGQVYYSIQVADPAKKQNFGGSASVRVMDASGNTRSINVTASCSYSNSSYAKLELLKQLESKKKYNEEFISAASYDVDACN